MNYRKRITLWAAVIAIGTVAAVSIVERLRAYRIADIISDEAAWDSIDSLASATDTVPVDKPDVLDSSATCMTAVIAGEDSLAVKDELTVKSPAIVDSIVAANNPPTTADSRKSVTDSSSVKASPAK